MADTLIDKVIALEKRAEEMVAEAGAQAKSLEAAAAHRLKEMQARSQAELERGRQELRAQTEARLKRALAEEDRRFAQLEEEIRGKAEPQVESAAAEVVRSFFESGSTGLPQRAQASGGGESGHGH